MSHAEKDALIRSLLSLVGQLAAALARIAELEARLAKLERPAKTPDNSSLPPSKGQKSDAPADGKPPRKGRPGVARALEPNLDRITDAGSMPVHTAPQLGWTRPKRRRWSMTASSCRRCGRT